MKDYDTEDKAQWTTGKPIPSLPIKYKWQLKLTKLFDLQIQLLRQDILRARGEDRVIVYLSCPISSRGGGYEITNVDIAKATQDDLMKKWGDGFWILNPARYQLESKAGTGLMKMHAKTLGINLDDYPKPAGGDYMRMWLKVLAEDPKLDPNTTDNEPWGRAFDAFYFIGPNDVNSYFTRGGSRTLTAGTEEYFARKYTMDKKFREYFAWDEDGKKRDGDPVKARNDFFRFYGIRASSNFSMGAHDEWNILKCLNDIRLEKFIHKSSGNGNVGELLAGYFDGHQIDLAASVTKTSKGYQQL